MYKRDDVKIFLLCHKIPEYGLIDNSIVTPLHVGAALSRDFVCETRDDTGDNISELNEFYTEDTGLYWIWKNVNDCKYKGQFQYRRRLLFPEYVVDFDETFTEFDAIIADPVDLRVVFDKPEYTLENQYGAAHNIEDLILLEKIIKEKYPEYGEDYDKYIKNGSEILYSNGFVLRKDDYNEYCAMLFDVLAEWLKRMSLNTMDDVRKFVMECIDDGRIPCDTMKDPNFESKDYICKYQMRIGGSLAERLFTVFARHKFKKILFLPYDKTENIEP